MMELEEHGVDWRMLTAFASDVVDATACAPSGSDKSMTEPEERAGWRMRTGFAGNTDATACAASGADRSMTEPEERTGWHECTQALPATGNADATASSDAAFGSTRAEVGTETTTALCPHS